MGVVIVGDRTGFSPGSAAANYVRLVADGLTAAGVTAQILPERALAGTAREANADVAAAIRARQEAGEADVIVYYGHSPAAILRLRRLSRRLGARFVLHLVEWPAAHPQRTARAQMSARVFCALAYRVPDAVIVISHWLEARAPRTLPAFRLPILARPSPEMPPPHDHGQPYAVLCADLDGYLPDALLAVEAVHHADLPELSLLLIGRAGPQTQDAIHAAARTAGMDGRVQLRTDFVPDQDLRALYRGAAALLAPLHDDNRSKARFPSKLAEYLLSGAPVVSNTVGEVAHYLSDGMSAYLAPPGDAAALGQALRRAVTDPARGRVGAAGRRLALREFDARVQGRRLAAFLAGLTSPASPGTLRE